MFPLLSIISQKQYCFRNAFCVVGFFFVVVAYLHELVALEHGCSLKYQLAVFTVIFESSHVDLTERHEFLQWRGEKFNVDTSTANS